MACARYVAAAFLLLARVPATNSQDLTPHASVPPDAFECSDAAVAIAGEPPGEARPLMERLFALDRCAPILAREQGATPIDVPSEGACNVEPSSSDWPVRSYVYRRTCAEGATERVWAAPGAATPSGAGLAATLTPEGPSQGR